MFLKYKTFITLNVTYLLRYEMGKKRKRKRRGERQAWSSLSRNFC